MTICSRDGTATMDRKSVLRQFIQDAGSLGTLRFVAVTDGAVLETVGRLDYALSEFSTGSGEYLSVQSQDRTFECHMNTSRVAKVTLSNEKAKIGGHDLHVIRFLDQQHKPLLSVMLMFDPTKGPGYYLHGAETSFRALSEKYGGELNFA